MYRTDLRTFISSHCQARHVFSTGTGSQSIAYLCFQSMTNNLCAAKCLRTTSDVLRAHFRTIVIIACALSITSLSTVVLGARTAEAAPKTWLIGPSPAPIPTEDDFLSVSCITSTNCLAVGSYVGGGEEDGQALADSWTGSTWTALTTPTENVGLGAASCTGPTTYCMAVGSQFVNQEWDDTFTEVWNGTEVAVIPSPDPGRTNSLDGVSCVSPTDCVAVGSQYDGEVNVQGQPLIVSWNGSVWSVVPSPNPNADEYSVLSSVSCVSADSCVAVGISKNSAGMVTAFTESWNGSIWSLDKNPKGIDHARLESVSCVSSTDCWAVGYYRDWHSFIGSWNGETWSIEPSPANGKDLLFGLSCASSKSCTAVGQQEESPNWQTLIESWNGTKWRVTPSPNVANITNLLMGVTCTSTDRCLAVGSDGQSS
jgi:hypothetical protein